jgi:hypothetical protein
MSDFNNSFLVSRQPTAEWIGCGIGSMYADHHGPKQQGERRRPSSHRGYQFEIAQQERALG